MELFIFILEIIGTIAFASSGAMTAIEKNMDVLGVSVLGMTTAVGGGVTRDLILGINPPNAFRNPVYAIVAIIVSIFIFVLINRNTFLTEKLGKKQYNWAVIFFDSIGLGIFTVVGINVGLMHYSSSNLFLLIFIGVVTGVGGGVLQDIMSDSIPRIFVKHIYASAAIIGAILCSLLWPVFGRTTAMLLGAAIIIIVRLLSAYYKWNLPRIKRVCDEAESVACTVDE